MRFFLFAKQPGPGSFWPTWAALTVTTLLSACTPGKMAVPSQVAQQMPEIPVTNRSKMTGSWADESFTMGPYRVGKVDRSGISSRGWKLNAAGFTRAGQTAWTSGYKYDFQTPGGPVQGECGTTTEQTQVGGRAQDVGQIGCRCWGSNLEAEAMARGPGGDWTGQAVLRRYTFSLRSISQYSGGLHSSNPLGFEVSSHVPLGAVETQRPGRVWLSSQLDPAGHAELACLFAGFVLMIDPEHDPAAAGSRVFGR